MEKQYLELRSKYPYLFIEKKDDGHIISGTIFIEKDDIKDRYEVEIRVAFDYPNSIPKVKETGSKIASTFHRNPDGTLCLETPLTVYEVFRINQTLIRFVDDLLLPYLYSYSYYLKHGKLPFGEHAHGAEGIFEDYKRRFQIADDSSVLRLIQILAEKSYRGHYICPCRSGKKIRDCHGKYLLSLINIKFDFMKDYLEILGWLKKTKNFEVSPFLPKNVREVLSQIKANSNQKWTY